MSSTLRDVQGKEHDNCGFMGPDTESVWLPGNVEVSLEEFVQLANHILRGGLFGWADRIPECVDEAEKQALIRTLKRLGLKIAVTA